MTEKNILQVLVTTGRLDCVLVKDVRNGQIGYLHSLCIPAGLQSGLVIEGLCPTPKNSNAPLPKCDSCEETIEWEPMSK